MKLKKRTSAALLAALLAVSLCGCAAGQAAGSMPGSTPESEALPAQSAAAPTAAPESSLPEETPLPQATPVPTPNPDGEWYSPDFLTEEQRAAYDQAVETTGYMLGESANLAFGYGNNPGKEFRPEGNDWPYIPIKSGPDSDYEAFRARMLAIYTESCLESLDFDFRFLSVEGQLAVNGGGYGSNIAYIGYSCPDLYRPEEQSDEAVRFTIIGHYVDSRDGESDDEFFARREAGDFDYTKEFTIRLVNTPDGWRVDEFHCPSYW